MRTLLATILIATVCTSTLCAAAPASGQRVGFGLEYDVVTGDADDAVGGFVYYEFDMPQPLTAMIEISYVSGDFEVPQRSVSGSYSSLSLGAALLLRHQLDVVEVYVGAGGANHWNDFDRIDYDNKLSMFWIGGARVPISEGLRAELGIRYRWLRPEAKDRDIGELSMDALVIRPGLVYEF